METAKRLFILTCAILTTFISALAQMPVVYFETADANLLADAKIEIDKDLPFFQNSSSLIVTGYADADGSADYNLQLAKDRADAVKNYLIEKGVNASIVNVATAGESQAKQGTTSTTAKQKDRKVEIIVSNVRTPQQIKDAAFKAPENFAVKPITKTIDPTKNNEVILNDKGTKLRIPAGAFVDASGKEVKTPVTLSFTEYTDPAQMAFSGINMMYNQSGSDKMFSSVGMFTISGQANGKDVQVAAGKSMSITYAMVDDQANVSFYKLSDQGEWKEVKKISGNKPANQSTTQNNDPNVKTEVVNDAYTGQMLKTTTKMDTATAKEIANVFGSNLNTKPTTEQVQYKNSYKSLNAELTVAGFGTYNCDRIAAQARKVDIYAFFWTTKGKLIPDISYVSVIDLSLNGAFGYAPNQNMSLDADAPNVIFVYTKTNHLYYLSKSEFEKLNIEKSGAYQITMKEISDTIKNTDDLKKLLNDEGLVSQAVAN